ncbi:MAG: hypothetical protein LBU06_06215 [Desulfovibrio sp.]|nr:hypothetical protein [Desulfovibrio sp.]
MESTMPLRDCLPPLAAAFSFPRQPLDSLLQDKLDAVISAGDFVVSAIFPDIRTILGHERLNAGEAQSLSGMVGTGVTLLKALCATARKKNIDPAKRKKLHNLLDEYQKLFEDIELFAGDITAEDCFRVACASGVLSDWCRAEEETAWQDL